MYTENKAIPSQELLDYVDFGLEALCEACPLRQAAYEGFLPAYGVQVDIDENDKPFVDVINFEILFEQTRSRLLNEKPTYRAVLNVDYLNESDVEEAFENCEMPSILPQRFRRDRLVCTALNRVLTDRVPNKSNLSVDKIADEFVGL